MYRVRRKNEIKRWEIYYLFLFGVKQRRWLRRA